MVDHGQGYSPALGRGGDPLIVMRCFLSMHHTTTNTTRTCGRLNGQKDSKYGSTHRRTARGDDSSAAMPMKKAVQLSRGDARWIHLRRLNDRQHRDPERERGETTTRVVITSGIEGRVCRCVCTEGSWYGSNVLQSDDRFSPLLLGVTMRRFGAATARYLTSRHRLVWCHPRAVGMGKRSACRRSVEVVPLARYN
jgi:hypothetical protein